MDQVCFTRYMMFLTVRLCRSFRFFMIYKNYVKHFSPSSLPSISPVSSLVCWQSSRGFHLLNVATVSMHLVFRCVSPLVLNRDATLPNRHKHVAHALIFRHSHDALVRFRKIQVPNILLRNSHCLLLSLFLERILRCGKSVKSIC